MLWNQTISLLSDLPAMFNKSNEWLLNLPKIILNLLIIQWLILFLILCEKKSLVLAICCKTFFSLYYELGFFRDLCLFSAINDVFYVER